MVLQQFLEEEAVPESGRVLNSTYDQILDEGRTEGRTEGQAELLLKLLAQRFGEVPAGLAQTVRAGTLAQLDAWADRLLTVESLEEVLAAG